MLAERVFRLRTERDWTQDELAAASGLAQSTIANIESGKRVNVRAATVERLASAFGLSPSEIWPGREGELVSLSPVESRPAPDVTGAEHDELLATIERLSPEQRAILRSVAEQMARANTPRVVG